jgi:hypothetical protein
MKRGTIGDYVNGVVVAFTSQRLERKEGTEADSQRSTARAIQKGIGVRRQGGRVFDGHIDERIPRNWKILEIAPQLNISQDNYK